MSWISARPRSVTNVRATEPPTPNLPPATSSRGMAFVVVSPNDSDWTRVCPVVVITAVGRIWAVVVMLEMLIASEIANDFDDPPRYFPWWEDASECARFIDRHALRAA